MGNGDFLERTVKGCVVLIIAGFFGWVIVLYYSDMAANGYSVPEATGMAILAIVVAVAALGALIGACYATGCVCEKADKDNLRAWLDR